MHLLADEMWIHVLNVEFLAQFCHKNVLLMAKNTKKVDLHCHFSSLLGMMSERFKNHFLCTQERHRVLQTRTLFYEIV